MTQEQATQFLLQSGQDPTINKHTQERFLRHCKEGNEEVVRAYLVLGMPTELHDEWGQETPLIRAAEGNHIDVIATLVEFGADTENVDNPGDTALQTAANWGNLNALKKLHSLGAKVDTCNKNGQTALTGALKNGKTDCYKYLLLYADPNLFAENYASLPHYCIWNGDISELENAFKKSKIKINPNLIDKHGDSLLHYALKRNEDEAITLLIKNGADLNLKNKYDWTPYEYAAAANSSMTTALLPDAKAADASKKKVQFLQAIHKGDIAELSRMSANGLDLGTFLDGTGQNALGIYLQTEDSRSIETTKWLIENGADINHFNMYGKAVVEIALSYNQFEAAKYLLSLGANPNNQEGWCECLYTALDACDLEMIQALVEAGMNIQDLSHYESTFVYGMTKDRKKAIEIIHYLGSKGANLNILDYLIFDSVLANLAYQLDFDRLKAFIEAGADVNFRDKNNENALMKLSGKYNCADKKAEKVAQYLLDKGSEIDQEGRFGGNVFYNVDSSHNSAVKKVLEKHVKDSLKKSLKKAKITKVEDADEAFFKDFAQTQNIATFMEWVKWKEYAVVEGLLRAGFSPNMPYLSAMKTPLMLAISAHDVKMVKLLLWYNADPNYEGKYNSFALNYAAYCNEEEHKSANYQILKMLLEKGADATQVNEWGESAFNSAISSQNWENMQLFHDFGVNINPSPVGYGAMIRAAQTGNEAIVEWVIAKGANINIVNHDKHNALHTAIDKDFTDIALILIENGIDIHLADLKGENPIIKAVNKGNEKLVEVLIARGADVNTKDKNGKSAKDYVNYRKGLKKYFVVEGGRKTDELPVNLSLLKEKPLTSLLTAIYARDYDEAIRLLGEGTDINTPNYRGDTPLMVAIATGQSHLAEKIIEKGADILLKNELGDEAFTLICMASGWEKIANLLAAKGRKMHANLDDLNQQAGNSMNYDALKAAIEKGDMQTIEKLLLEKKCDINLLNYHQSPLHLVAARNDIDIAELLLQRGASPFVKDIYGQLPLDITVHADMNTLILRYMR